MYPRNPIGDNNAQPQQQQQQQPGQIVGNNGIQIFNPNMVPNSFLGMGPGPLVATKPIPGPLQFPSNMPFMPGSKALVGPGMAFPYPTGMQGPGHLMPVPNQIAAGANKKEDKRILFVPVDEKPVLEKDADIKYGAWNNKNDVYRNGDEDHEGSKLPKMLGWKEDQAKEQNGQKRSSPIVTQRRIYVNVSMKERLFLSKDNFGEMKPLTRIEYLDGNISCYTECLFNLEKALGISRKEDFEVFEKTINHCDKISWSILNEKKSPIKNREHILALVVYSFDWLLFENVQKYTGKQSFDNPLNIYRSLNKSLIKRPEKSFSRSLGYLGYLDQALLSLEPLNLPGGSFCYCWGKIEPEFIDSIKRVGVVVQLRCYQSAVLDREVLDTVLEGGEGVVVFKIRSVNGRDITPFSTVTVRQVLLMPGTKYKVAGVSSSDRNVEITLDESF